jgi:hypothetical protein
MLNSIAHVKVKNISLIAGCGDTPKKFQQLGRQREENYGL